MCKRDRPYSAQAQRPPRRARARSPEPFTPCRAILRSVSKCTLLAVPTACVPARRSILRVASKASCRAGTCSRASARSLQQTARNCVLRVWPVLASSLSYRDLKSRWWSMERSLPSGPGGKRMARMAPATQASNSAWADADGKLTRRTRPFPATTTRGRSLAWNAGSFVRALL